MSTRKPEENPLTDEEYDAFVEMLPRILYTPVAIPISGEDRSVFVQRLHDDHDGSYVGSVSVGISVDGDMWIATTSSDNPSPTHLRFRTAYGGTMSLRTHAALRLLFRAIQADNEARPIDQSCR